MIIFRLRQTWFNSQKHKRPEKFQFSSVKTFLYGDALKQVGIVEETDKKIVGYVLNDPKRPLKSFSLRKIEWPR